MKWEYSQGRCLPRPARFGRSKQRPYDGRQHSGKLGQTYRAKLGGGNRCRCRDRRSANIPLFKVRELGPDHRGFFT